jgi:hypothetical protein
MVYTGGTNAVANFLDARVYVVQLGTETPQHVHLLIAAHFIQMMLNLLNPKHGGGARRLLV